MNCNCVYEALLALKCRLVIGSKPGRPRRCAVTLITSVPEFPNKIGICISSEEVVCSSDTTIPTRVATLHVRHDMIQARVVR